MEEIAKEIGNDTEAFRCRRGVGVGSQFTRLEAIHSPTSLRTELRAACIEPLDMFLCDFVSVSIVCEFVSAVRDKIWEDEGNRLIGVIDTTHVQRVSYEAEKRRDERFQELQSRFYRIPEVLLPSNEISWI